MGVEIQFIANCDEWKVIKKLKITKEVPELDKIIFLSSISISFDAKIELYLKKTTNIKPVEDYIEAITKGIGKSEEDFAKVLKALVSPNAGKAINVCIPANLAPKDKELLKTYLKIYMTKKALSKIGLNVDFSKVPIPANKGK